MAAQTCWGTEVCLNSTITDLLQSRVRCRESRARQRRTRRQWIPNIVGNSAALRRVLDMVRIVAPTDATVLIKGETGTGKELIDEAIHKSSDRSNGPFVKVNCETHGRPSEQGLEGRKDIVDV